MHAAGFAVCRQLNDQRLEVSVKLTLIAFVAIITAACGSQEGAVRAAEEPPIDAAVAQPVAEPVAAPPVQRAQPVAQPVQRSSAGSSTNRRVESRGTAAVAPALDPAPVAAATRPAARIPEYREYTIPAGTMLPLRLTSAVASDASQIEDAVSASFRQDLMLDGSLVVPAGSEVSGRVVDVERSGRVKGRARLAMRFNMLKQDGDEYDIRTEAVERLAAATKGEDATKIGIGAGAGAALGAILGGGSGAAKGAAIGAAAGTGAVLATRGEEVRLEPGETIDTRLTAPLVVRVRVN
jgi:hypothetical protein